MTRYAFQIRATRIKNAPTPTTAKSVIIGLPPQARYPTTRDSAPATPFGHLRISLAVATAWGKTRFRLVPAAVAAKPRARSFTLDGEAMVASADGVAVFDALERRGRVTGSSFSLRSSRPAVRLWRHLTDPPVRCSHARRGCARLPWHDRAPDRPFL